MDIDNERRSQELITRKVLPKFFLALLITFAGMVVGALFIPPGIAVFMPFVVLLLLIVAFFVKAKPKNKRTQNQKFDYSSSRMRISMAFVYFIALIIGIGSYPAIVHYLHDMGAQMVLMALGVTTILFGAIALYAYKSKRDFSGLGVFLFIALLAVILLGIAGLFIHASLFHLVLAFAGILIFSGYILYDISNMKRSNFTEEDVPMAVLDLLLDFINIFLDVLRILSIFSRD